MTESKTITKLWEDSKGFKKFWKSYFFMVTHPKQCLRLLNFACKALRAYNIKTEE